MRRRAVHSKPFLYFRRGYWYVQIGKKNWTAWDFNWALDLVKDYWRQKNWEQLMRERGQQEMGN
jgi:hypothetical protein